MSDIISGARFPYCVKDYLNPRRLYRFGKHLYQRAKYGASFADRWNFDYHIAKVLVYSLPFYKNSCEEGHGMYMLDENGETTHYDDETQQQEGMQRWDDMIDTIVNNLRVVFIDERDWQTEEHTLSYFFEEEEQLTQEALALFTKHFRSFWD